MPKYAIYQGKRIDYYYDRSWRTWVAFKVNEKGEQTHAAQYDSNKLGAIRAAALETKEY